MFDRIRGTTDRNDGPRDPARSHWAMILIVAMALILAVGFFYMTEQRRDRRADQITDAAGNLSGAADRLSDAARDATNRF